MKQYLTMQYYSLCLWENTLLTLFPYIITRHVTHNLNIIIKIGGGKQNTENTSTAKNSWKHNTTNTYNNTKNQMCAHWAGEASMARSAARGISILTQQQRVQTCPGCFDALLHAVRRARRIAQCLVCPCRRHNPCPGANAAVVVVHSATYFLRLDLVTGFRVWNNWSKFINRLFYDFLQKMGVVEVQSNLVLLNFSKIVSSSLHIDGLSTT